MTRSECCGAKVYDDIHICSECKDHCDVWVDEEHTPFGREQDKKTRDQLDDLSIVDETVFRLENPFMANKIYKRGK